MTAGSNGPARSGRPPRETTALTSQSGWAAAPERRCRSGAGSEEADRPRHVGPPLGPPGGGAQPIGQRPHIEDARAVRLLLHCQQVDQQRGQTGPVQHARHVAVTRAVTAAAAPVGEDHRTERSGGHRETTGERHLAPRDADFLVVDENAVVRRIRRHGVVTVGRELQELHDLLVRRLREVAVPLPHRIEGLRDVDTQHLVADVPERQDREARGDGRGEHDSCRPVCACHLTGGARRRTGGDTVIDDDSASIVEAEARTVTPVLSGALLQLDTLPAFDRLDVIDPEARRPHHLLVDDPNSALADGSHRQLGLEGHPELPHDDHVERRSEGLGHLEGDGHPATGQPEHHDVAAPDVGPLHHLGQVAAGVHPIAVPYDSLLEVTCSVSPTHLHGLEPMVPWGPVSPAPRPGATFPEECRSGLIRRCGRRRTS